ncbi:unnamed protein product, partial [Mesorhabditis belari]|uniref:C-type lectin domain-containing protein n=1 Tax=Mesorhabditis belari TaxID=2138241 RepID=A0AAF3EX91_9BILA
MTSLSFLLILKALLLLADSSTHYQEKESPVGDFVREELPEDARLAVCRRKSELLDIKLKERDNELAVKTCELTALSGDFNKSLLYLRETNSKLQNELKASQVTVKNLEGKVAKLETTLKNSMECRGNWVYFNGYCYKIANQAVNKTTSAALCERENAHLVSIHSREENNFILELSQGDYWTWIGLQWADEEWVWSDGSAFDYSNWALREPNRIEENPWGRVQFSSGSWFNYGNTQFSVTICKKRKCFGDGVYYPDLRACILGVKEPGSVCKKMGGGHLVSIHNAFQNTLFAELQQNLTGSSVGLIGAIRIVKTDWVWSDATSFDYSKILASTDDCLILDSQDQMWKAVNCDATFSFLCSSRPLS